MRLPLPDHSDAGRRGCLIVEDQPETLAWLRQVVNTVFPDMAVAVAETLRDASAWLAGHQAAPPWRLDLALVDLGLPDGSGVELIRQLCEIAPHAAPIVATIYDDDAHLFEAISAGARGYLLKSEDPGLVGRWLRRIETGEPPLSPSIARRVLAHFGAQAKPPRDEARLSARETEVLTLLARGMTVAETAATLRLSPQTVASYVKTIYQKLNVSNRAGAALAAAERRLI